MSLCLLDPPVLFQGSIVAICGCLLLFPSLLTSPPWRQIIVAIVHILVSLLPALQRCRNYWSLQITFHWKPSFRALMTFNVFWKRVGGWVMPSLNFPQRLSIDNVRSFFSKSMNSAYVVLCQSLTCSNICISINIWSRHDFTFLNPVRSSRSFLSSAGVILLRIIC